MMLIVTRSTSLQKTSVLHKSSRHLCGPVSLKMDNSAVRNLSPVPTQKVAWPLCSEAESEGVEVGVVEGHTAHPTFMHEIRVCVPSCLINHNLEILQNRPISTFSSGDVFARAAHFSNLYNEVGE